jgi:cytoskeletal protein RodZ
VIAAALVAVVVGLGLVVPGLIGGNNTETTGLPAPGQPTVAAVTEAPTPTPSATSKPKHTKKTVAHTPSKTTKTSSRGSGTTPAKGGTQTSSASSVAATTPKQVWGTTVVPANSALKVGQNWHTNRIKLSLTTAGDAVLTDENGKVTWSAGKTGGTALAFQGDGNLVLYQDGTVLWATKTMGNDGAKLVLQDDGNVTISRGGEFLWGAL